VTVRDSLKKALMMRGLIPECCAVYRIQDGYGLCVMVFALRISPWSYPVWPVLSNTVEVVFRVQNDMILCTKTIYALNTWLKKNGKLLEKDLITSRTGII